MTDTIGVRGMDRKATEAAPITDYRLDITEAKCPMTFVRTRLMLDRMASGQTLEVRLKGAEPLENVPRSARGLGHEVVSLRPEDPAAAGPADTWRLVLRKH